jgi:glyoxylase-like metal-dependent hydrolase (beta-lactamase superfamily II)
MIIGRLPDYPILVLIHSAARPPFMKNGFVLACERTREAVYIDPGDEVDELLAFITDQQLTTRAILLTHAHVDHVSGVARAKRRLAVPIHLHADDVFLYQQAEAHGRMFGLNVEAPPPADVFYAPGAPYRFGEHRVDILHTPGHCPGGVCLAVSGGTPEGVPYELFVGDTLFAGSIGRTDLPGGDYETLLRSITGVLFPLGDACRVYPGHGPSTTIGDERRTNPFILEYLSGR